MIELIKDFLIGVGINIMEWQTILFLSFAILAVILLFRR